MSRSDEDTKLQALYATLAEQDLQVTTGGGFEVEAIPTGVASFDRSTGIGGVPRQRVSVFQGEEGSGKTLLLLTLIANVQRSGGRAAFVDLEHALTPDFARLLGVNYEALAISRPRTLNAAYDVARPLCESGLFDVVGFDSAVALATLDEIEKSSQSGSKRASQAQVHSEELKKVVSTIDARTALIIINQLRENPNPPNWWRGGKLLYAPGGKAIKHASSLTVEVYKRKAYKNGTVQIGHKIETYIDKNKCGVPYQCAEFDLMYDSGIDMTADLIQTALRLGVIEQRGSRFYYDVRNLDTGEVLEEKNWNGRAALDEAIKSDAALRMNIGVAVSMLEGTADE